MRIFYKLSLIAVLFVLVGAGCQSKSNNTPAVAEPLEKSDNILITDTTADTEVIEEAEKITDLPEIDDTWETYLSKSETFSFKWPTRGRYAPHWTASFVQKDDERLDEENCIKSDTPSTLLIVDEMKFCHTSNIAKDKKSSTDYYTTLADNQYILITFTKDTSKTPKGFSWAEYQEHLNQIVSTFKYLK